jgi:hypothetical protein
MCFEGLPFKRTTNDVVSTREEKQPNLQNAGRRDNNMNVKKVKGYE